VQAERLSSPKPKREHYGQQRLFSGAFYLFKKSPCLVN
jgi:hypothetical protein